MGAHKRVDAERTGGPYAAFPQLRDQVTGRRGQPYKTRVHGSTAPVDLTDPGATTWTRDQYYEETSR